MPAYSVSALTSQIAYWRCHSMLRFEVLAGLGEHCFARLYPTQSWPLAAWAICHCHQTVTRRYSPSSSWQQYGHGQLKSHGSSASVFRSTRAYLHRHLDLFSHLVNWVTIFDLPSSQLQGLTPRCCASLGYRCDQRR